MRNILILVMVLFLLAGVYFLVIGKGGSTSFDPADVDFSVEDTASISKIEISRYIKNERREAILLEKIQPGEWTVNQKFPVQPPKIVHLLGVIKKLIVKEALTPVAIESALEKLKMNHILVDIYDTKGIIKSYFIGPTNQQQTGNVMLLKGGKFPIS